MTAAREVPSEVGAVVVTFFPDGEFPQRLAAITREFSAVTIVDNSADAATRAAVRAASAAHGATLIENAGNAGLARALNQALARLAPASEWVALFDQDSTPEPGFRTALLATAARTPAIAVVGANWSDEGRPGFASRHLRPHPVLPLAFQRVPADEDLDGITCVITSGSLFHVPTLRALGGFDEGLFLDLVDTDYCLRVRARRSTIAVASAACLRHRRGSKRPVHFVGRTWWPAFMPPPRLRYLFRNRVLLLWRHGWRFPHWAAFEFAFAAKIVVEILLLEDNKTRKLAACLAGTLHGLLGRSGPIP